MCAKAASLVQPLGVVAGGDEKRSSRVGPDDRAGPPGSGAVVVDNGTKMASRLSSSASSAWTRLGQLAAARTWWRRAGVVGSDGRSRTAAVTIRHTLRAPICGAQLARAR